jgi:hypothetical protein
MKNGIKIFVLLLSVMLIAALNFALAADDVIEDSAPPILPEFIEEGADQQIKKWEKIFGDQFIDIINAMEAVKTGDIQTFIKSGVNIIKVAPEILPKLGLDLIIPINENYLGNIKIDPEEIDAGINFDNQLLEIENLQNLDVGKIVLELAITGYNSDRIKIIKNLEQKLITLDSDGIIAETTSIISLKNGKVYIQEKDSDQPNEIKKLPSYALREVKTRYKKFKENSINLRVEDEKAFYEIDGYIDGKILWIIPIKADVLVKYDAEKGLIKHIDKPWWEIFVF